MGHDQVARVRGAGRDGVGATRPVSDPPPHDARLGSGSGIDVTASEKSTRVWEAAYRQYGRAWEMTARSGKGDPVAAREMATASWAVAAAWRQITTATTLPWWALAAIESAAGAFESQARDYEKGDTSEGS
ncbi:MAG: hypothetical protein DLM60_08230 [Pseudonocardiales bacterium]|nr:MAG: hypothetical protein DLM60_08230 [Pseudonocardiales bacterium]